MMFPSWIRCPNSDCSWFTSLPLFLPSSTCTHNNIGKWLISIYICMSIYVYHMGPCSVFQLILNLIVFIFLFSPLGCTIKCMKCKNGPTHVLLFLGGKIQRNVECWSLDICFYLGDEVELRHSTPIPIYMWYYWRYVNGYF